MAHRPDSHGDRAMTALDQALAAAAMLLCILALASPGLAQSQAPAEAAPSGSPASAEAPPPGSPTPSCAPGQATASSAPAGATDGSDVTVFAASSLTDAFEALQEPWAGSHPGSDLILSLDSSSILRAQIEEGAPADVFVSADLANAQVLVDGCLARAPLTVFAGNSLTIVVPAGDPAGIGSPAGLARPGVRYVAAGPQVPITRYARQAIDRLSELDGYPSDFAAAVAANTISEEDNVRAVLAKIELGEGDSAIVYATDAASSDDVVAIPLPQEADVPATYAAVAVTEGPEPAMGAAFLEFLLAPEAQAILERFGFLPAEALPST
jgi:molybdate transport system substrate-binding protein